MVTIALYGGPLKRVIVQRAYGMLGQSVAEFELTPEEYDVALQACDSIAGTLGAISWNYAYNGDGSAEDESGLAAADVLGFTVMVAQELAQNIGKQFAPNATQARQKSSLIARYQVIPSMELGRNTVRGAGNTRYQRWAGPFYYTDISDSETPQ